MYPQPFLAMAKAHADASVLEVAARGDSFSSPVQAWLPTPDTTAFIRQGDLIAWSMNQSVETRLGGVIVIPEYWARMSVTLEWAPATTAAGDIMFRLQLAQHDVGEQIGATAAFANATVANAAATTYEMARTVLFADLDLAASGMTKDGAATLFTLWRRGDQEGDTYGATVLPVRIIFARTA